MIFRRFPGFSFVQSRDKNKNIRRASYCYCPPVFNVIRTFSIFIALCFARQCEKCFFHLSKSTQTLTCGVPKHDDSSVNGIGVRREEAGEEEKKEEEETSRAHRTKSNLLLWSTKSKSSNSTTLLPNRSTDMMCCAPDREGERSARAHTQGEDRKMGMRASARA